MAAAEEVDDASNGDPSDQMPAMRKQVEELAFGQFLKPLGCDRSVGTQLVSNRSAGANKQSDRRVTIFFGGKP